MRMLDATLSAATALTWYHLSPERQYTDGNVQLYHDIAALSARDKYAEEVADLTCGVNGQLLEIGAGTGIVSRALAERHGERLLCTDIEPSALVLNPHTRKHVADCRNLPVESSSLDAVVGVGVYRYIQNRTADAFWSEMHRVIRQGGKLILGEFHPRIVGLRGSRIGKATVKGLFSLETWSLHPARVEVGKKTMRIGEYHTYAFQAT